MPCVSHCLLHCPCGRQVARYADSNLSGDADALTALSSLVNFASMGAAADAERRGSHDDDDDDDEVCSSMSSAVENHSFPA